MSVISKIVPFIEMILEKPSEHGPHLVLASWYEENGMLRAAKRHIHFAQLVKNGKNFLKGNSKTYRCSFVNNDNVYILDYSGKTHSLHSYVNKMGNKEKKRNKKSFENRKRACVHTESRRIRYLSGRAALRY